MLRTFLCLLALVACKDKRTEPPKAAPEAPKTVTPSPDKPKDPVEPKTAMPKAAEITPLVKGSNDFGLDLWARAPKGNLAISPVSIETALAMTWAGAKTATADQMHKVLHFEGTPDAIVSQWGLVSLALQDPDRPLKLKMANRLYAEKSFKFDTTYFTITRKAFKAPLEMVDFKGAPDEQRKKINQWVADQTEQRIKDLLPPPMITDTTRLVIVNAIYFLADWARPFDKTHTSDEPFYGTKTKPVPTMHDLGSYRLAKGEGASMLELPYKNDSAAMYVLLPDKRDGLAELERSLPAKLKALQPKLAAAEVSVSLPKFVIDPAEPLQLADVLVALGMKDAFDAKKADFTGIGTPPDPNNKLYISSVLHKAFVKVDEKGTEAAAATAVEMLEGAGAPPPSVPFTADHPFVFFILDRETGLMLFMGRVVDPA